MDVKEQRIEKLVRKLVKLAIKYKIPPDTDLGEACLMTAATMLERHVDRHGFMERARAWWDLSVSTPLIEPIGPSLKTMEQSARDMAETVRVTAPPGAGFALVVFNFGPRGEMTYVSTGDRNDTIGMLDSLVQTLKTERTKAPGGEMRS